MNFLTKNDDGFVGITDEKRRMILEAERDADALGVLPDDKEKRAFVIEQLSRRLANANLGWGFDMQETVVRVDNNGVPRVIPKSQAVGWMKGLPAHPNSPGNSKVHGRTKPFSQPHAFNAPPIPSVEPRVAAERFHSRIVNEMQRTGYVPAALREELAVEGWKLGQPVPREKVDEWCSRFQIEFHNKHNRR